MEPWYLYSIAFVLIFIRDQYNPDPLLLGLAAAGTQGGALIGGWLSDKIGRRVMFLVTMIMFVVLALAQAFVPMRRHQQRTLPSQQSEHHQQLHGAAGLSLPPSTACRKKVSAGCSFVFPEILNLG